MAVDEPLVELETDKVTIEVPAPSAGMLGEIAAKDGETVAVGALLGQINDGAAGAAKPAAAPAKAAAAAAAGTAAAPLLLQRRRRPTRRWRRRCARFRRKRRRCRHRSGLRQGWPGDQGRHAGCDREGGFGADPGQSAGRRRAGARAVARRRCRARRAREDDAAAPDHRAPPQGRAKHRRDADDLQRGRHGPHHGDARPVQGRVREEARQQTWIYGLLHQGRACRR